MANKKPKNDIVDIEIHKMQYEKVYESANAVLRFTHVGTSAAIQFMAYLTSFADNFQSEWNKSPAYGRMDNIANFVGTSRSISLAWDIPSYSVDQAKVHLSYVSQLATFLYPIVDPGKDGIGNINTPPLLRLEFGNLIKDTSSNQGLLGFIDGGLTITPDLEVGMFIENGMFYPKTIRLSLNYTVLHTHKLGFFDGLNRKFPYDVNNDYHNGREDYIKYYKENQATEESSNSEKTNSVQDAVNSSKTDDMLQYMRF